MELNDCAFPILEKIICTDNQEEVKIHISSKYK